MSVGAYVVRFLNRGKLYRSGCVSYRAIDLVWLEEECLFGVGCMRLVFLCVCGVLSNDSFCCVVVGCVFV